LLNYQLLSLTLNKACFNFKILTLFSNYLIGRKTQYLWNIFCSLFFSINIGVEQDSALSSVLSSVLSFVLSALYISLIFHIFEKRTKNFNIPILFLFFVDDGLFISQDKIFDNMLFFSVVIILSLCSLTNLDLSLNMENLKFFIFLNCMETSTLLLSILVY